MHDDHLLTEARLSRVLDERLRPAVLSARLPLQAARFDVPGEPVPFKAAVAADYRPAGPGEPWGPPWGTTWLRLTGTVPADWAGRMVQAELDLGFDAAQPGFSAEGLAFLPDGTAVKGLHPRNRRLPVAATAVGGQQVCWYVEAAGNPLIGLPVTDLGDRATAGDAPLYTLGALDLCLVEPQVQALVDDLDVLQGLLTTLPVTGQRRWEITVAVGRALDRLDLQAITATAAASRAELHAVLAAPASASAHLVSAVGHAHIDTAWLWPQRETMRKVARTAANVLALLDEHPGLVFAMSQAQQWVWLKEHQPALFERVRRQVQAGRFVPVGGMWVESDTNMPGGEALARQFVHGKRFFADEFAIDTQEVWLPDSFGYSGALPQLVALSGSRWFLTQKISWSATNRFPHHTFWWEGLDGTRVFTHFPPVDTYNSDLSAPELVHAETGFAEKGLARRSLVPFGYGDGGGGPTREMLARADRLADLEGAPRVEIEAPAAFFAKAEAEYPDAPVWVGELYLELHRGTYTSQAKTKQGNRRGEALLREAELWCATAALRTGADYPYEQLDRCWKVLLLHQFHDILPGSAIAWVHREARQVYADLAAELTGLVDTAIARLAGTGTVPMAFNAAPHRRDEVAALGAGPAAAPDVPGSAQVVIDVAADGGHLLDNGLLRVAIDPAGLIRSVLDLGSARELIAPDAPANLLQLHQDLPNHWDAWDVDAFYRNTSRNLDAVDSITVGQAGGCAQVVVLRSDGASTYRQTITLAPDARRLDCRIDIDWHEREKFLKVAFPLDIRADRSAAETQFGHVFRATDTNTSWEAARFEICAHRFLHVAEPDFGIAVVNDSTYGHDVTRTVRPDGGTTTAVRLSLLRAPRYPDPHTDQGVHTMRYALVPCAGIVDAVREGYAVNLPVRTIAGVGAAVEPLVTVDDDRVVVEAVKLADDESGDLIVRLYEACGTRARCIVRFGFATASVDVVDLLERSLTGSGAAAAPAQTAAGTGPVALTLRPFQIITLRARRAPG